MWEELGISGGTAIIVLAALYFVIKWAVKNGVLAAYEKTWTNTLKKRRKERKRNSPKTGGRGHPIGGILCCPILTKLSWLCYHRENSKIQRR